MGGWAAAFCLPPGINAAVVELLGGDLDSAATVPGTVIALAVFFCYVPVCTYFWGATPGKLVFRLRVINYNTGEPVSVARSWGRFFLHALFAVMCWEVLFLVGHLWLLGEEGRPLHDKAAGTTVIQLSPPGEPVTIARP
ncbi:RDD family protein [Streptomyces sp. NPDC045470]|uniref:RDD family protein n=1 Tax=Streptomyces sp. NPDC045470 TaxID=3155469 RepID=UPI0033C9BB05